MVMPTHSVDAELLGETDAADLDLSDLDGERVERAAGWVRDETGRPGAALLRARWFRG
jgi:hypothetical protein